MTRNDLALRFAEQMGIEFDEAMHYVEVFMDVVVENLGKGERIEIRDFGVFQIVERDGRVARNPRTGVKVKVAPRRTVKFKTGKALLERVREAGFRDAEQQAMAATAKGKAGARRKK